jgi:hypothetical protein
VSHIRKYTYLAPQMGALAECGAAIRWFVTVGRSRAGALGLTLLPMPSGGKEFLDKLGDADLASLYMTILGKVEVVGGKIITPVVDSILAGRTAGFSPQQLRALGGVKWQAFLLEQESEWMKKFFDMTFTATADNHTIAEENLDNRAKSYARRCLTLLRTIRAARGARSGSGLCCARGCAGAVRVPRLRQIKSDGRAAVSARSSA